MDKAAKGLSLAARPCLLQVVERYPEDLGLGKTDSKQSRTILAAHGPKKLAALAAAVRISQFLDRCEQLCGL
jgi:hypothetical protein